MRKTISDFLADSRGNAALEYGLVLAAVGIGLVSAVSALGEALGEIYRSVLSALVAMNGATLG